MTERRFLRLPEVLQRIPVSKSSFWAGIRSGRFPKPVKLTERTSAWRESDIDALCAKLSGTAPEGQGGGLSKQARAD